MLDAGFPLAEIDATELRQLLAGSDRTARPVLLDVRQPLEYQAGHLPRAISIPLARLADRLDELDPAAEIITCCGSGARSRAAAELLLRHGFSRVRYLAGGYRGWLKPDGQPPPVADLAAFQAVDTPEQHVALAWLLEEAARQFYQQVGMLWSENHRELFATLVRAEQGHQQTLLAVYEGLTKQRPPGNFPQGLLPSGVGEGVMEGGYRVAAALELAQTQDLAAICELAMAVETHACEHYQQLQRAAKDENCQRIFEVLAIEERRHLEWLSDALDRLLHSAGD